MPPEGRSGPAIPLARWADRQLRSLAAATGSAAISALSGSILLGERAALGGFSIPRRRSAGGKCHLLATRDGWLALNLARDDDRDLLPALFGQRMEDPADIGEIADLAYPCRVAELVARGREMGLAIAASSESGEAPALEMLVEGPRIAPSARAPLVVDLSALWAGPLCAHLLHLAGAQVVKVESSTRPDAMRDGDAALFARLNGGKDNVALDFRAPEGRAALLTLLERADVVIEAARPRALLQMGIDAAALLAARPGKVWVTITAHGASGAVADWVGFGDDCGVSGGLSAALQRATGTMGFVGDAIADPLTGIRAARAAWSAWQAGQTSRIGLSMSGVVREALTQEREFDEALLTDELKVWGEAAGRPFPPLAEREPAGPVHALGADHARWSSC